VASPRSWVSPSSAGRGDRQPFLRPGQRADCTIQTNGTLLDAEWAAFFLEHDFLVDISIDEPRDIHDANRLTKGGKGTFDQVMTGLDVLRDECGAEYLQFTPIIERTEATADETPVMWTSWRDRPLYIQNGDLATDRSVGEEQFGTFLVDVFEE